MVKGGKMNCTRCTIDMVNESEVYKVAGFYGYFCVACAEFLGHKLGMPSEAVTNLPYYTEG